jgi:hypothetical protein
MRSSALLLSLLATGVARGQTIDASSFTLLAGHAEPRDGRTYTVVPIYEQVGVTVSDLRIRFVDDFRIVVSAWGEIAFGDPREGLATGDVDLGFVEGKLFRRHLELRVGRQLVFGGAARALQLDGAQATWRIWRGLGVTAYGGAPVTPRFGESRGDVAGGVRAFYRPRYGVEVGASFVHLGDQGRTARQELGADARWQVIDALALTGFAMLSTVEWRLAEADLAAEWQPRFVRDLDVRVDWRRTAPDLFVPRSSIFSVFALETRDEGGGSIYWRPHPRVPLAGDYHVIADDAGIGHRGGGKVALRLGPRFETTVGAEVRVLELPAQGFVQTRLFAAYRIRDAWTVTVDLDAYKLARPVNGQDLSLTGAATVGWEFARGWRAVVAAMADQTPLVERRFEMMAKLVWDHRFRVRVRK